MLFIDDFFLWGDLQGGKEQLPSVYTFTGHSGFKDTVKKIHQAGKWKNSNREMMYLNKL